MENESPFVIYKITNLKNGKSYIGRTSRGLHQRKQEHIYASRRNPISAISEAINKHGEDNFKFEIISRYLDPSELPENEALFISKLNTISPNGYNKQRSSIPNKSDGPTVVAARVPFWLLEKVEAERNKESYPRKLPHMFLELVSEALDARDASN